MANLLGSNTNAAHAKVELLDNILPPRNENTTSDVLAYVLSGSPTYLDEFLRCIDSTLSEATSIERELNLDRTSRPDFIITGNNWELVIENKPWDTSSLQEGQLQKYANFIESRQDKDKKQHLCLLLTDSNQKKLLSEAAKVVGIQRTSEAGITSAPESHYKEKLESYYKEKDIAFHVITWDTILAKLEEIQPNNEFAKLWFDVLDQCISPSKIILSPENEENFNAICNRWYWNKIKSCVEGAKDDVSKKLQNDEYSVGNLIWYPGSYQRRFTGFSVTDALNGIKYWIGACVNIWH